MKTSIGFRLSAAVCAAILFIGVFSFMSAPTHAEGAAEKARKAAEAAAAKAVAVRKCKELEAALKEAEKEQKAAEDEEKKAEADRSTSRRLHYARDNANKARAEVKKLRAAYDAVKPCGDLEKAMAEAEEALKKAEELLAEKIKESGDSENPPKKLVEEKAKLDKLKKDLHPPQGTVVEQTARQASVTTKASDGLRVINFETLAGRVKVNLPDDMRAGDTISGTVIAEPKGNNEAERSRNLAALSGFVVELRPPVMANPSNSFVGDTGNNRIQRVNPNGLAPPSGPTGAVRGTLIFVGDTANNRIQRSTDGGRTWQAFTGGAGSGGSSGVAPESQTPPQALLRSMDGGATWQVIDGGPMTFTLRLDQGPGVIDVSLNRLAQDSTPLPGEVIATTKFEIYDYPGGYPEPKAITNSRPVIVGAPTASDFGNRFTVTGPFSIPDLGQQGRPVEIPGPFDGSFQNTRLTMQGKEVPLLTESPRRLIFQSPRDISGPVELTLKEGNTERKGTYRNVSVNLTAPKTNLLKGESTTLTVKVEGLQGIKEDVPLHLENASPAVVRMAGGDKQTFGIKPSTVQPDGTFSTTRAVTGQQAGAFTMTATVVVFNMCLQDDDNGNSLAFSSGTGDVIFCDSAGGRLYLYADLSFGQDQDVLTNPPLAIRPGVTRNGTLLAADYNFTGGHFALQLDGHTGTATIQKTNPKQTITITDRDTRNNTCTCK